MAVQKLPREATEPTDVARSKTLPPEVPAPAPGGAGFTDAFGLAITFAPDAVAVGTDDAGFQLALAQTDTVDAQIEAVELKFPAGTFADPTVVPTDARSLSLRCWASGCVTNETSAGNSVAPANANGENNGTRCNCTTGTGTPPGSVNPVTVTTGSMNVPGGLTVVSAQIRLFFRTTAALAAIVNSPGVDIRIIAPAGLTQNLWVGPGLGVLYGGENYDGGNYVVPLPGPPSLADLQAIVLQARYSNALIALPDYAIQVDAWCVEIEATI